MSHLIERAIIMAAGQGTRLNPLTQRIPKPLIKVNGTAMIDTIVSALHSNGIFEIYVVVGHLKHEFEHWVKKYRDVHLIENPWFKECNNISSLYVAREYLKNVLIIDGDQIIANKSILSREFSQSGYCCAWCEGDTKEWLLTLKNGNVSSCSRYGGTNGWQLFGVSRWTEADGKMLRKHVEKQFSELKNSSVYWDDLALFIYPQMYSLAVYPIKYGDIYEIDNLAELQEMDPSYL